MDHGRLSSGNRATREAIRQLDAAQELLSNDATPASEGALICIESARSVLLSTTTFGDEAIAEAALVRRVAQVLSHQLGGCVWFRSENAIAFLSRLLSNDDSEPRSALSRPELLRVAQVTKLVSGTTRSVVHVIDALRREGFIESAPNGKLRLTEQAAKLQDTVSD